jgi:hypothetical protein
MEPLMIIATTFATLNVALLVGLIYLYARIVLKTRAGYPVGLLIFAVLLFMQNSMTVFGYTMMGGFFDDQVYPVLIGITLSEFAGLVALLKVTL